MFKSSKETENNLVERIASLEAEVGAQKEFINKLLSMIEHERKYMNEVRTKDIETIDEITKRLTEKFT